MSSSATAFHLTAPLTSATGGRRSRRAAVGGVRCGLADLIGGDLVRPDLGRWLQDVEKHKALAVYSPHEGGYEGRYLNRLRYQGYRFLDLTARGLGDPESTLTKIHPVCPVRPFFFCFFVDYRALHVVTEGSGVILNRIYDRFTS